MRFFFKVATFLLIVFSVFAPVTILAQMLPNTQGQTEPNLIQSFPVPQNINTFLGQKHDYSVILRGNGEVVISARVALTNSTDKELKQIELRLPDYIKANDLTAFQVIREGYCLRFTQVSLCEEYAEPDYFQSYGQNKYQKAQVEFAGDTLKIALPTAIAKDKSGAFFVYLRAAGFAKKDIFGVFNFKFETLKVNESIQNLQVGISTDSDLVLKDAKGAVDYRFSDQARALAAPGLSEKVQTSAAIDNFYNQIGYGSIIKTASNLAALESYQITGAYAKTQLMLYAKEILVGLGVFVVIFLVVAIAVRLILRRSTSPRAFFWSFLASLISTIATALYTVALLFIGRVLDSSYYYGPADSQTFIWLLMVVVSFAVYAFLILAPAILVGIKKGIGWGLATLGLTILWLVLLIFVLGMILFLSGVGQTEAPPVPLLEGSAKPEVSRSAPSLETSKP